MRQAVQRKQWPSHAFHEDWVCSCHLLRAVMLVWDRLHTCGARLLIRATNMLMLQPEPVDFFVSVF